MKIKLISAILTITMAIALLTACGETNGSDKVEIVEDNPTDEAKPDNSRNSFGEFQGKTVDGEEISSDVFADYELTMVNIWGTFCKPCIDEMDELEELYQQLPENINMFTICYDADSQIELAAQILETKGATFDTLVVDDNMRSTILKDYMVFPTTLFVDKDGNVIGTSMLGGPAFNIVETYMNEIDARLAKIGE